MNIALLLIGIIAIYLIGKKMNWWSEPEKPNEWGTGTTDDPINPERKDQNPTWKSVRSGFDAAREAQTIADLLSHSDFLDFLPEESRKDYQAFQKILNNYHNENIEIHNAWLELYGGGSFWSGISGTLKKQVKAEYLDPWRTKTIDLKKKAIARLEYIGL